MTRDRAGFLVPPPLLLVILAISGCSTEDPAAAPETSGVGATKVVGTATDGSDSTGDGSRRAGTAPTGPDGPAETDPTGTQPQDEASVGPDPAVVEQALTGADPPLWRLSMCSERLGISADDQERGRPLYLPCEGESPLEQSVARVVDSELDIDEVVRLILEAPTDEEAEAGFEPLGSPSVRFTTFVTHEGVLVLDVVGTQEARNLVEFSVGRFGLLANLMVDDYQDVALLVDGVPFCRNMGGC